MIKSLLGKVLGGISNLGPVKNLIKYILDRSLNELLTDQISLQDFKNGELLLRNITLNIDKINEQYLLSSPYIIHKGVIRRLTITLPSFSQLSTNSIQLHAEGLQIDLKPNKHFCDTFKEAMRERQVEMEEELEEAGEVGENNPMDFFRQLVKQIIMNMKVGVENSVVRLFINDPANTAPKKPQYYLMLRIPKLNIGKGEENNPKSEIIPMAKLKEQQDLIRFDLVVPQISVHLLREGVPLPEFSNEKPSAAEDFPFLYPTISHPGTLLVIGGKEGESATKLTLALMTDYKAEKKELIVEGQMGRAQLTIDPIQLKIITRFIAQIGQFQRVLRGVMRDLGLGSTISLNRRPSRSSNNDVFSSLMMSISQPTKSATTSAQTEMYKNMLNKPEMKEAKNEFNNVAMSELEKSGMQVVQRNSQSSIYQGYKQITFKQELRLFFEVNSLKANILKYVTNISYSRQWNEPCLSINEQAGCSHFHLQMNNLHYSFDSTTSRHHASIHSVRVMDVRLHSAQIVTKSVREEFYDPNSSTYQNQSVPQDYFTQRPELIVFEPEPEKQYYSAQQLFRVSKGKTVLPQSKTVQSRSFMPVSKGEEGEGIVVLFDANKKELRVEVKEVAVMANLGVWKDVLNMMYPVWRYKRLAEKASLEFEHIESQKEGGTWSKGVNLLQSQYKFTSSMMEEVPRKDNQFQMKIKVGLGYCLYRESDSIRVGDDLIGQVDRMAIDGENFGKSSFCDVNERAIYAEVQGCEFQRVGDEFTLTTEQVKAGLTAIDHSELPLEMQVMLLLEHVSVRELRTATANTMLTQILLPRVKGRLEVHELITLADMLKNIIRIVDGLSEFNRTLKCRVVSLDHQQLPMNKSTKDTKEKVKKNRVFELLVNEIELKMLIISIFLKTVYYHKAGKDQQFKFNALAIGSSSHHHTKLGQFRNQLQTVEYPQTSKYSGIPDSNIILEIGRESKGYKAPPPDPPVKSSLQVSRFGKINDFKGLDRDLLSFTVMVKERTEGWQNIPSKSQSFRFRNVPGRSSATIPEEKCSMEVQVLFSHPLHIHMSMLILLLRDPQPIKDITTKVQTVLADIGNSQEHIPLRKQSIESEGDPSQIEVNIKGFHIHVDAHPEYTHDLKTGERVLSCTRMYSVISVNKLYFKIVPEMREVYANLVCDAESYFLHYQDKDPELNPFFLSEGVLQQMGFRKILMITALTLDFSSQMATQTSQVELTVDKTSINLCLSSLPYLQMFRTHMVRHTLAGDYGENEEEMFEVLSDGEVMEEDDEEIEDMTDKIEQLEQKLLAKRQAQDQFTQAQFMPEKPKNSKGVLIKLKRVTLCDLTVTFHAGNEFVFVKDSSLYESKATKRIRKEAPTSNESLTHRLNGIVIKGHLSESSSILLELERSRLSFAYERKEGWLWGQQDHRTIDILTTEAPIKVLVNTSEEYLHVKMNRMDLSAHVSDQLFSFAKHYTASNEELQKQGWNRVYRVPKPAKDAPLVPVQMVLILLPEGRITATAEFQSARLLSERVLHLGRLVIHEEKQNGARIMQLVDIWMKAVLKDNLGSLLGGALLEVLTSAIALLLTAVRNILGLLFPALRQ